MGQNIQQQAPNPNMQHLEFVHQQRTMLNTAQQSLISQQRLQEKETIRSQKSEIKLLKQEIKASEKLTKDTQKILRNSSKERQQKNDQIKDKQARKVIFRSERKIDLECQKDKIQAGRDLSKSLWQVAKTY